MATSFKSGFTTTIVLAAGLMFFAALVIFSPLVILVIWLWLELKGRSAGKVTELWVFGLDDMELARLDTSRNEASDTIARLVGLEEREQDGSDPYMIEAERDQLISHYQVLRSTMAHLRQLPAKRLRTWSSYRAGRFTARISILLLTTTAAIIFVSDHFAVKHPPVDIWRWISTGSLIWSVTAAPLLYFWRRTHLERSFSGIDEFRENTLPDDEGFLDHYLATHGAKKEKQQQQSESYSADGAGQDYAAPPPEDPVVEEIDPVRPRVKRPWHEVLEIEATASEKAIKAAWRIQIKLYHPDRLIGFGPELIALAEAITREINQAYEEALRGR